ncbi:UNVERIFIED_CONTAM: cah-2 [Trichonephila clavipes]
MSEPVLPSVGQEVPLHHVSVQGLLPSTSHFVTYEGSLTVPACHESVTWLVINRPIYITKQQPRQILQYLHEYEHSRRKAPLLTSEILDKTEKFDKADIKCKSSRELNTVFFGSL